MRDKKSSRTVGRGRGRRAGAISVALLASGALFASALPALAAPPEGSPSAGRPGAAPNPPGKPPEGEKPGNSGRGRGGEHRVTRGPLSGLPPGLAKRLAEAKITSPAGATSTSLAIAAEPEPQQSTDMRVLVMATKGDPNPDGVVPIPNGSWDWELSTLTDALDYMGVPYDVYKGTTKQLCHDGSWKLRVGSNTESGCTSGKVTAWTDGVTPDRLASDAENRAYYQGVMQTNGTLSYLTADGSFPSALTAPEWAALWEFEAQYGIRTVSANTYPTADFGFTGTPTEDGNVTSASYTAAGGSAFPYVNSGGTFQISGGWTYRARTDPSDTTATPLITDGSGNALAVLKTYPNQGDREALALTFGNATYLTHGQVLGYGLVNWVTKGLFLGERKAVLTAQPDDIFIENERWPVGTPCGTSPEDPSLPTYRMTGNDLNAVVSWLRAKREHPNSRDLTYEMPYNGEGTTGIYSPDTLTRAAQRQQGEFMWINHTWDHTNLDAVTYDQAMPLLTQNDDLATSLGLTRYNRASLIQPDISGLDNAEFLRAAKDFGMKWLILDTSRTADFGANGQNEGRFNRHEPSILELARYPVNLYYNIDTPESWLAEDNCLYPAGAFGHVSNYEQLLDRESNQLLRYLLHGHNRPLMFHQANLRNYSGGSHVLGDLIDATLAKYNNLVDVPILTLPHDTLGQMQAERMQYNDAWKNGQLSGRIVGDTVVLTSQKDVTVPVTGAAAAAPNGTTETYAGQSIARVPVEAGQTVTINRG